MKVYIEDMLAKSKANTNNMAHLKDTFNILQMYQIKLNQAKCAFRVKSSKFLGFMMNQQGIEASLKKIKALLNI